MAGLENLELGVDEWRALLDADAVPGSLKGATVDLKRRQVRPLTAVAIINELLARRGRPLIKQAILEGQPPVPG